jgi:hypothetical protein
MNGKEFTVSDDDRFSRAHAEYWKGTAMSTLACDNDHDGEASILMHRLQFPTVASRVCI